MIDQLCPFLDQSARQEWVVALAAAQFPGVSIDELPELTVRVMQSTAHAVLVKSLEVLAFPRCRERPCEDTPLTAVLLEGDHGPTVCCDRHLIATMTKAQTPVVLTVEVTPELSREAAEFFADLR